MDELPSTRVFRPRRNLEDFSSLPGLLGRIPVLLTTNTSKKKPGASKFSRLHTRL
jgi:hypothetical protein